MINHISGHQGPGQIEPKRHENSRRVDRSNEDTRTGEPLQDKVQISEAAKKQHSKISLVDKARAILKQDSVVRQDSLARAREHLAENKIQHGGIDPQIADELLKSDELKDVIQTAMIKNKIAELEKSELKEGADLDLIQLKMADNFYDSDRVIMEIVDLIFQNTGYSE